MDIHECARLACIMRQAGRGIEFLLVTPGRATQCRWLDPQLGLIQVCSSGETPENRVLTVAQVAATRPSPVCVSLQYIDMPVTMAKPSASGTPTGEYVQVGNNDLRFMDGSGSGFNHVVLWDADDGDVICINEDDIEALVGTLNAHLDKYNLRSKPSPPPAT